MDKVPYDAWLHWFITMRCNLDCEYCFANLTKKSARPKPIAIKNVLRSLDRSQKVYRISLTGGGEPFLVPNINEFCAELTKKHYLSINTNLTSPKIKVFAGLINPERIVRIHASLHIAELFRKKLANQFIENYQLLNDKGINLEVRAVAFPDLAEKVAEYKKWFSEKGVEFEFEPFIGNYHQKKYPESYTEEELKIFKLKIGSQDIFFQKNKTCNAGFNAGIVMPNGNIYSCVNISQSLGNLNQEIKFKNHLTKCPFNQCGCPLNFYDLNLFRKALENKDLKIKGRNRVVNFISRIKVLGWL